MEMGDNRTYCPGIHTPALAISSYDRRLLMGADLIKVGDKITIKIVDYKTGKTIDEVYIGTEDYDELQIEIEGGERR